jgi:hypothetical protein
VTPEAALRRILAETCACVAALPDLAAFSGGLVREDLPYTPLEPLPLAVLDRLPAMRDRAGPATAALTEAILAGAPLLRWRQSYTEAQVGAAYLRRYGWFNLIAPSGPFISEQTRVSMGYWEAGMTYPRHWHRPAEMYLVIAGAALFQRDGAPDRLCGPGDVYENPPSAIHAAIMDPGPLIALAVWKGEGLEETPTIVGEPAR